VIGGLLLYFLVFSGDDDESANLTTGSPTSPDQIEDFVGTLHELREAAPEEVEDDWAKIDDPFQDVSAALDEAGITWDEAADMDPGDLPDEVLQAGEDLNSSLGELDLSAISQSIEDHAQDECGINPEEFQNTDQ
jgi:hypothetical protein